MSDMTKTERDELAKLVRRREKLAKADADRVVAERLADFEGNMASVYRPEHDAVWAELHAAARDAVAVADEQIAQRCREFGIQDEFRPSLSMNWHRRGENAAAARRAELRQVAKTRIDALAKSAKVEIERRSIGVQTELLAGGLQSDEAKAFLSAMPTADELMPAAPTVAEIEAAIDGPGHRLACARPPRGVPSTRG